VTPQGEAGRLGIERRADFRAHLAFTATRSAGGAHGGDDGVHHSARFAQGRDLVSVLPQPQAVHHRGGAMQSESGQPLVQVEREPGAHFLVHGDGGDALERLARRGGGAVGIVPGKEALRGDAVREELRRVHRRRNQARLARRRQDQRQQALPDVHVKAGQIHQVSPRG